MISILFVDDEVPAVDVGTKVLEKLGYKVTPVTRSLEALDIFRKHPLEFDLVITDYNMPGMNGDELALEIRFIRTDIPIILCTGYASIPESNLQKWGIDALLLKPYRSNEIDLLVSETVRK
jgi:CheY-like chemotaxis protein